MKFSIVAYFDGLVFQDPCQPDISCNKKKSSSKKDNEKLEECG